MAEPDTQSNDELLKKLLPLLAPRGIARRWGLLPQPHTALVLECRRLAAAPGLATEFREYLAANPIVRQSMDTMLAQLAMVANVRWQTVPDIVHPLARQGWHISRWLPTFLIVDGPLGRVLRAADSPLHKALRARPGEYPVLAEARDAFNSETFRLVRNGVGHWSFLWQEVPSGSQLVIIDARDGTPTTTITLLEAEALHLLAYSVIEALDHEVFRSVAAGNGA
jgi:hypothetical protein